LTTYYDASICSFCRKNDSSEELLYKDQVLKFIDCKMEPESISWENLSLPTSAKVLRIFLQLFLLVIVLSFSIILIYSLALVQAILTGSNFIIGLGLPLLISFLKFLFAELMKALVGVRRYSTEIHKLKYQIIITFVFYFTLAGLLQFLLFV